uniref:tRNA (guanosine(46)-N7)-methyltransferase TrmB n=1 Tax=Ningiella ruwaisensis TaxID=2364274 RepID=UPI00109FE6C3|nr:tRNA (guanosine(46)-N7)-methyltransferase TrmB [Ningiella ruwaisensis]
MSRFKSEEEARAAGVYIAKVKSFVKREGRLTNAQAKAIETLWPQMGLSVEQGMLNLNDVFARQAPRVLEIGFGMGKSLVEMASKAPDTDFIGIEVHRPGVGACLADAADANLTNLRLFEHDAVEVLKRCIKDESLDRLQLFFPDPWHKKRHHKRRIVQSDFVKNIRSKLKIGGEFHMATDWEPYAEHMIEVMEQAPGFENTAQSGLYVERPDYRPITKFEVRGQKLGHGVWDIIYRRVS